MQANQESTLRDSFFVPSTISGEFFIYLVTDISNSVMEIDGEENNVLRSNATLSVAQVPAVTLDVNVNTDALPSEFYTGQTFVVEYSVMNGGQVALGATSWVDGIYLSNIANPSRSYLLNDGFLLTQTLNGMELVQNATYTVMLNVTLPYQITDQRFLAVLVDMNNVLNIQTVGTLGTVISIEQGSLPDLTVNVISSDLNITSGQPAVIEYTVINDGDGAATGQWYEAVILSQNSELDPFDTRLLTIRNPTQGQLRANESYNQSLEVFIPFDLPTSFYFIFVIVDTRNDLYEDQVDNNQDHFIVFITETVSTDLVVLDVLVSPNQVVYKERMSFSWRLRNNGSLQAIGYKCDSIYLSRDEVWDIMDHELGTPQCGAVTLNAFTNNVRNDRVLTRTAIAPFIAQQEYYGLVRTRTNIRDPNLGNNIGSTTNLIHITAPNITLGILTTITLEPNDNVQVFRIPEVPEDETLVATLFTTQQYVYHDLFLRHRQAPTGAEHDAFSQFPLSSNQSAVVRHSRSGAYYLRVEGFTSSIVSSGYSVEVLVKVAQFEILRIAPVMAAPLGNVTIRITGTVISHLVSASLVNSSGDVLHQAIQIYWFNSETVYATFDLLGAEFGDYSVRLTVTDGDVGAIAQLNNSFTIATGIPGRLTINVLSPERLRPGETGDIVVQIQNIGNTDLMTPHLVIVSSGQTQFRLLDDYGPIGSAQQIDFLGLPLEGPGGILPPDVSTEVTFRASQTMQGTGQARYNVKSQTNGTAPHPFLDKKSSLRPMFMTFEVWDTVWENFISSVGTTQQSFQQRLSEIATEFSLVGKKAYSVTELVQYQLQVAYGLLSGNTFISLEDQFDETETSFFPLTITRTYSAYLHKRRTEGPMGTGWILKWWELHIENVNAYNITLWKERESFVFRKSTDGSYRSEGETMFKSPEGVYYFDNGGIFFYLFNPLSGKLMRVGGYVHNVTLNFQYSEGRLQSIEHSESGKRLRISYNNFDLIETIELLDTNGIAMKRNSYSYDSSGRYLTSAVIENTTVYYSYNANGDLINATDIYGSSMRIGYNEYGWVERIERFDSNSEQVSNTEYTTSWNGRMDITESPKNISRTLVHDKLGNVVSIITNKGLPIKSVEQPYGRQRLLGDEVIVENRVQGNTLYSIDPDGVEYKYVRNDDGNIVLFEDGDRNSYSFSYNLDGLQNSSSYPDGTTINFVYDVDGHLSTLINQDGTLIDFTYDDEDNLISRSSSGNLTSFEYNAEKQLVSAHNGNSRASLVYNEKGFPSELHYSSGHTLYYGYNQKGQRSYIADNHGYNISYIYDSQSRLSEVRKSNEDSLISRFEYNNGQVVRKILGNGAYSLYTYNKANQITLLENYLPNNTLSSSNCYDYDKRGRVVKMTDSSNQTWVYRYDITGQLTGWTSSNGESIGYIYDNRGNRLVTVKGESPERYSVNRMNQYASYNETEQYFYDANGNLVRKVTPFGTESYGYDAEGRLIFTETLNNRCVYYYDPFGNINQKNCSSGSYHYVVDPFGIFGADIIAEVSENGTVYFVHSRAEGLLAALKTNGDLFYEFNMDGNVEKILDANGRILNSYKYDVFGKIIYRSELTRNIFKYGGLLGVVHEEELENVYMMRARHYDAQHGRFLSMDPSGLNGKSPNFYMYALNNPLSVKDPTGRIPLPVITSVISVGVHLLTTPPSQVTFGSVLGAGASGLIGGGAGIVRAAVLTVSSSLAGDIVKYGVDAGIDHIQGNEVADPNLAGSLHNAGFDLVWGALPGKFIFQPLENALRRGDVGEKLTAILTKPRENFYKTISKKIYDESVSDSIINQDEELKNILNELADEISRATEEAGRFYEELYVDIIQWVLSRDPNDIIGPVGYGDAHFISPYMRLDYKIRFENDPNATAPAQRVLIQMNLDEDMDIRSFRVGTYGFGDFVRNVTTNQAIIQETLDLTSSLGLFVRMRGGLDIIRGEAVWEIMSLDPTTGEAPSDPSIGFLPPNNGTTGQGFVTFSVYVNEDVSNLATIDAQATIIFDANEPINTPPIFNTIDKEPPDVYLTVNTDLLDAGVLAVNLRKIDSGSGVREVDLYQIMPDNNDVVPVVSGAQNDIVILPLSAETEYTFFSSSVDNVGNRRPLQSALQDTVQLNFPISFATCPNNCSNNGNCTVFGDCVCDSGFYGGDCSDVTPPSEPPVFEMPLIVTGVENELVVFQIAATIPGTDNTEGLQILIDYVPMRSRFSRGSQVGERWIFTPQEFGVVELDLPPGTSGRLNLEIIATANGASRSRPLILNILSINNTTDVPASDNCPAEQTIVPALEVGGLEVVLKWSETLRGEVENIQCPCGNLSALGGVRFNRFASRRCGGNLVDGAQWDEPVVAACNFSITTRRLCQISNILNEDPAEAIQRLYNLTEAEKLIGVDEFTISTILLEALSVRIAMEQDIQLKESLYDVIDNLMDVEPVTIQASHEESNATARILNVIEEVAQTIPLPENETMAVILLEDFAVTVTDISKGYEFQGHDFSVDLGMRFTSEDADLSLNQGDITFMMSPQATASLSISRDFFQSPSVSMAISAASNDIGYNESLSLRIINSVYLSDTLFIRAENSTTSNASVGGIILSSTLVLINSTETSVLRVTNLKPPITLTFMKKQSLANDTDTSCNFWDFRANEGYGDWSTMNCTLVNDTSTKAVCECTHFTNFAILLDPNPIDIAYPKELEETLSAVSYIGVIISIICLIITALTYLLSGKLRQSEAGQLLLHLCFGLLGIYVIFIIGLQVTHYTYVCAIAGGLYHYFFLVTFFLMSAEALNLFLKLVIVLGIPPIIKNRYVLKAALISWLTPLVIVILSEAPDYKNYVKRDLFCRPYDAPFYGGLVTPFAIIYIFNWVIFGIIFVSLLRKKKMKVGSSGDDKKSKMQAKLRRQFIIALNLSLLFGLGWGVGLIATTSIRNVAVTAILQAIFIFLTAFQGIFIFIMQCARSEDARKEWIRWVQLITANKITWDVDNKKFKRASDRTTSMELTKRPKRPPVNNIYSSVSSTSGISKKTISKSFDESSFATGTVEEIGKKDLSQEKNELSTTAEENKDDVSEEKIDLSSVDEKVEQDPPIHTGDLSPEYKMPNDTTKLLTMSPVIKASPADETNTIVCDAEDLQESCQDVTFVNPGALFDAPIDISDIEKHAEN